VEAGLLDEGCCNSWPTPVHRNPRRYGYNAAACTTLYDFICEVPQTKFTCTDAPPVPPPVAPACGCLGALKLLRWLMIEMPDLPVHVCWYLTLPLPQACRKTPTCCTATPRWGLATGWDQALLPGSCWLPG
jgi:hypothetical protein